MWSEAYGLGSQKGEPTHIWDVWKELLRDLEPTLLQNCLNCNLARALSGVFEKILQAAAGCEQGDVSWASHISGFTCFRGEVLVPRGGTAEFAEPSTEQENWCCLFPAVL